MIYEAFLKRFINAKTVHNYELVHKAFTNRFTIVGLILNVFTNRKGFIIKEKADKCEVAGRFKSLNTQVVRCGKFQASHPQFFYPKLTFVLKVG